MQTNTVAAAVKSALRNAIAAEKAAEAAAASAITAAGLVFSGGTDHLTDEEQLEIEVAREAIRERCDVYVAARARRAAEDRVINWCAAQMRTTAGHAAVATDIDMVIKAALGTNLKARAKVVSLAMRMAA